MRRSMIIVVVMVLAMMLAACAPAAGTAVPATAPTVSVPVTGDTPTAIGPAMRYLRHSLGKRLKHAGCAAHRVTLKRPSSRKHQYDQRTGQVLA